MLYKMDYPSPMFLCRIPQEPNPIMCHSSIGNSSSHKSLDRTWVRVLRIPHWSASPPSPDDTRRSHAYSWEVVEREWSVAAPRRNVMGWGVEGTSAVSGAPLFDTRLWRCSLFQAYFLGVGRFKSAMADRRCIQWILYNKLIKKLLCIYNLQYIIGALAYWMRISIRNHLICEFMT